MFRKNSVPCLPEGKVVNEVGAGAVPGLGQRGGGDGVQLAHLNLGHRQRHQDPVLEQTHALLLSLSLGHLDSVSSPRPQPNINSKGVYLRLTAAFPDFSSTISFGGSFYI